MELFYNKKLGFPVVAQDYVIVRECTFYRGIVIVNARYRVQYGIYFPSSDFSYKYFPSIQARKIYKKI